MRPETEAKRETILVAALTQFSRYGFRRTSMEDIATEAGISRASIYSYFENKEEIFRSLATSLHERALCDAESQLERADDTSSRGSELAVRVEAALLARLRPFLELVSDSVHGSEIYDESNRLCGDLVQRSSKRFEALLAGCLKRAARRGEIDLKAVGLTPATAAELVQLGAHGLKHGSPDIATFEKRLGRFVKVFFAGLR